MSLGSERLAMLVGLGQGRDLYGGGRLAAGVVGRATDIAPI